MILNVSWSFCHNSDNRWAARADGSSGCFLLWCEVILAADLARSSAHCSHISFTVGGSVGQPAHRLHNINKQSWDWKNHYSCQYHVGHGFMHRCYQCMHLTPHWSLLRCHSALCLITDTSVWKYGVITLNKHSSIVCCLFISPSSLVTFVYCFHLSPAVQ